MNLFSNCFFLYFSHLLIYEIMIGKINLAEIIENYQMLLYLTIFLLLLAIFGTVKLVQLIKKVRAQKNKMQNLVKEYENFLNQREKK